MLGSGCVLIHIQKKYKQYNLTYTNTNWYVMAGVDDYFALFFIRNLIWKQWECGFVCGSINRLSIQYTILFLKIINRTSVIRLLLSMMHCITAQCQTIFTSFHEFFLSIFPNICRRYSNLQSETIFLISLYFEIKDSQVLSCRVRYPGITRTWQVFDFCKTPYPTQRVLWLMWYFHSLARQFRNFCRILVPVFGYGVHISYPYLKEFCDFCRTSYPT